MVSFSVDLDSFSLRLRVEAAPKEPRARKLRMEEGSGTDLKRPSLSVTSRIGCGSDTESGAIWKFGVTSSSSNDTSQMPSSGPKKLTDDDKGVGE